MGQIRLPGNPPIDVILRRSARARRISLRLSRLDGTVTLTMPTRVPEAEAVAFARQKETWLRGHLRQQEAPQVVGFGITIPLEGQPHEIVQGSARSVRVCAGRIEVPGDSETVSSKVRAFLRTLARDRLASASDLYAARLGRSYGRITLRDTRSRWGSCTAEGNLMYSWRLVLAPPDVLDYVAAHEVAHLQEMNHSDAFWSVVTRIYGDWRPQRDWLRRHGADLHRVRFAD